MITIAVYRSSLVPLCLLVVLIIASCKESLPDRHDPVAALVGKMSSFAQTKYSDTTITTYMTVTNVYSDYLDDVAVFQGSIDIVLARDPLIHKHAPLSAANVFFARDYTPATGHLTIAPGDSVILRYVWNMADDAGHNLADPGDHGSPILKFSRDTICAARYVAKSDTFAVSGQINVFTNVGSVVSPTKMFKVCFVRYITFDPQCSPPQLGPECSNP